MLRRLQVISHKNADAMFKAGSAMKRGRLVQKDHATKSAVLPSSTDELYFVTKDNYPIGLMSLEGELSDYDPRFEAISANEPVILEKPLSGERYGTTEYVSTGLVAGDYLIVEVAAGDDQGKLKKNDTATKFKFAPTVPRSNIASRSSSGTSYTSGETTLIIKLESSRFGSAPFSPISLAQASITEEISVSSTFKFTLRSTFDAHSNTLPSSDI